MINFKLVIFGHYLANLYCQIYCLCFSISALVKSKIFGGLLIFCLVAMWCGQPVSMVSMATVYDVIKLNQMWDLSTDVCFFGRSFISTLSPFLCFIESYLNCWRFSRTYFVAISLTFITLVIVKWQLQDMWNCGYPGNYMILDRFVEMYWYSYCGNGGNIKDFYFSFLIDC